MARGSAKKEPLQSEKKEPSAASTALDNIPTDKLTRRREFIDHRDALISEAKEAAGEVAAHNKRLTETFNVEKQVLGWLKDCRKMAPDRRARALRQFIFFLKDFDLQDTQLNLFNDDGQPGGIENTKDEGSVFDKTGNKAAPLESKRDAEPKLTGAEPPPHVPSVGISNEAALAGFTEAKEKAEAKRAGKANLKLVEPPSSKPDLPVPPGAKAEPASKPRRLSREPSDSDKAAAKNIADKYIPPAADPKADDDRDDTPGTYQVH